MEKEKGVITLIFGLLIITRNYIQVNYRGYEIGVYYFAMNFVGAIAIIYGLYQLITKK